VEQKILEVLKPEMTRAPDSGVLYNRHEEQAALELYKGTSTSTGAMMGSFEEVQTALQKTSEDKQL
jgi:hypothetical protein